MEATGNPYVAVLVLLLSNIGLLLVDTLRRYIRHKTKDWDIDTPEGDDGN